MSATTRDSILTERMAEIPEAARFRKPTEDEKRELMRQQAPGLAPWGRAARLPGEPVSVDLPNGGFSIVYFPPSKGRPVRGPTREDSIRAEDRARLLRLQELARRRRDSAQAKPPPHP
jgi:hypothetical protein